MLVEDAMRVNQLGRPSLGTAPVHPAEVQALFNPETSILSQKSPFHSGHLHYKAPGHSCKVILHGEMLWMSSASVQHCANKAMLQYTR